MKYIQALLITCLICLFSNTAVAESPAVLPSGKFVVLTFHDVYDDSLSAEPNDAYGISSNNLAQFFDWMKRNNWHPVSLQQIIDAQQGKQSLPPNAVLLNFEDGLASHYSRLFPLLKVYQYPAMLALVTGWISEHQEATQQGKTAKAYLDWTQIQQMQASGLINFVAHSHNLHQGIVANPQGDLEPAALARYYDVNNRNYETASQYLQRVKLDIQRSIDLIAQHTGAKPLAVIWPDGAKPALAAEILASVKVPLSFSLVETDASHNMRASSEDIPQVFIAGNPSSNDIWQMAVAAASDSSATEPQRAIRISLDQIYSASPAEFEQYLAVLVDNVKALKINQVYLSPVSNIDEKSLQQHVYFQNRYLPVVADVFNHVLWKLQTKAHVQVFVDLSTMPLKSLDAIKHQRVLEDLFANNAAVLSGVLLPHQLESSIEGTDGNLIDAMKHQGVLQDSFRIIKEVKVQTANEAGSIQQMKALAGKANELMITIPLIKNDKDRKQWLNEIINTASSIQKDRTAVIFNTVQNDQHTNDKQLYKQFMFLVGHGVLNLSYQPPENVKDAAHFQTLFKGISLNTYPHYYQEPPSFRRLT